MNETPFLRTTVIAVGIVIFGITFAEGYEKYSENDDATFCRECHGDFRSNSYTSPVDGQNWGNLHNIHRSTMLASDCDVCHIGNDKLPVYLNSSSGGDGFAPVGCMGCHGVDPAPNVPNNNWWGAGLRLHHANAGVGQDSNGDTCMTCHTSDPSPPPEDTLPSYYFAPDANHTNKPVDPCNQAPGFSENFAGAVMGFDNDGDRLYDGSDPDCAEPTPTPTNTPTWTPTPTPAATPPIVNTPTSTPTPTATPNPIFIFSDGFESGDSSLWSAVAQGFTKGLDQVRRAGRMPTTNETVFLLAFAGAALVGVPAGRKRRRRRQHHKTR